MSENGVHIHKFKDTIVPPTCIEKGYTLHQCDCGYEYKDSFVPCGPHKFDLLEEIAPSCEETGVRKLRCLVCGEVREFGIDALEHDWSNWSVQTVATCTENGKQIRACKRCGEIEEQAIKATGHKFSSRKKSKEHKGMVECFCENCGETIITKSRTRKALKKLLLFVLLPLILIAAIVFASIEYIIPAYHYSQAKKLIESKEYDDAYFHLVECPDYKDSSQIMCDFVVEFKKESRTITYAEGNKTKTSTKRKFDDNGNVTGEFYYNEDGNLYSKHIYEYDKNGNQTLSAYYGDDGKLSYKDIYEYDKNGNQTLSAQYDGEGNLKYKYVYKYDENGNKTFSFSYNEKGDLTEKSVYIYDELGNKTMCVDYDANGVEKRKYVYEYDKSGNETSYTEYDKNGKVTQKSICEYDRNGNRTLYAYYDENGEATQKSVYKYDENGNQTLYEKYNKDKLELKCIKEYNEKGNPISLIYDDKLYKSVSKYIYEYDDFNNLTFYKHYYDGVLADKCEWEYDFQKETVKQTITEYEEGEFYSKRVIIMEGMNIRYDPEEINSNIYWNFTSLGEIYSVKDIEKLFAAIG